MARTSKDPTKPPAKKKQTCAESDGSTKAKGKRATTAATKKTAAKGDGSPTSDGEDTGDGIYVDWDKDNHALSWSLLSAITDDLTIQNALFPPPGASQSTRNGGGKPKMDYYWKLYNVLFSMHLEYNQEPSRKTVKLVNKARTTLGKTGEGLDRASNITNTLPEHWRNKWDEIQSSCPYFFELRDLIAQRPNDCLAGVGHAGTQIDTSAVLSENDSEPGPDMTEEFNELDDDEEQQQSSKEAVGSGEEAEEEEEEVAGTNKRKSATSSHKTPAKPSKKPKTPARLDPSTPTSSTSDSKGRGKVKKFKGALDFEELAKNEEHTKQKELDVACEKIQYGATKLKLKAKLALQ
ncbi:hypothetical protein C8Q80DRAFT_1274843 [Daedaleopsis nitida]|nr:hypothetical protein C8Q80DRAFT_1274843 [Daedaleopsis nitida]